MLANLFIYLISFLNSNKLKETLNIHIYSPFICVSVKPTLIEMPRVRILNENFDTPKRQFPVGTAIQLTCQGQVGSDQSKVRINAY